MTYKSVRFQPNFQCVVLIFNIFNFFSQKIKPLKKDNLLGGHENGELDVTFILKESHILSGQLFLSKTYKNNFIFIFMSFIVSQFFQIDSVVLNVIYH